MNYYYFVFSLLMLFSVNSVQAEFPQSCPKMSQENNCDLYDKCLEAKNSCGENGYPLKYGLKFCKLFKDMDLSNQGEKWITGTMGCLQDELVDFAYAKTSCDKIEENAFNSHVSCYVSSGFCDLPITDKTEIAKTSFWSLVTSLQGANQAAKTLAECL